MTFEISGDPDSFDGVFVPIEGTNHFRLDFDKLRESMSPPVRRNWDRRNIVTRTQMWLIRHLPWMSWPLLHMVYTFWICLMDEGIVSTLKPRWGAMTFSYLNDGIKPSVWHTLYTIFHRPHAEYSGIYVSGAPKSRKEAEEWETSHGL